MDKIKVGVIGVGSMGKNHVRAYTTLNHICELVGVYDIDQQLSYEIAQSYGVKSFPTAESLMDKVDAINIATPTSTHYKIAMDAINKGLHLLIEKPITSQIEEAQSILKAAKKKNLILQVGHIERFNPAIRALPKLLEDKKIIALDVKRMGPYDPRISDTDVIQDLMIHDIDVVSSILPERIKGISAFASRVKSTDFMDYAVANIMMESGVIATLTASRVTQKKVRKMVITTLSSYIELDYIQRKITVTHRGGLMPDGRNYQRENEFEEIYADEEEPLKSQLSHFIQSIKNGTKPLISGSDGLEALKLAKLIQNHVYRQETERFVQQISN